MGSLLDRLDAEERALADRVKEIQEQIMALAAESDTATQELAQCQIARQVIARMEARSGALVDVSEGPLDTPAVEEEVYGRNEPLATATAQHARDLVQHPQPEEPRAEVPVWNARIPRDELSAQMPAVYWRLVGVMAVAPSPQRPADMCRSLGLGTDRRHTEGMRGKMNRLVARGWCVAPVGGGYVLAPGVRKWLG